MDTQVIIDMHRCIMELVSGLNSCVCVFPNKQLVPCNRFDKELEGMFHGQLAITVYISIPMSNLEVSYYPCTSSTFATDVPANALGSPLPNEFLSVN